MQSRHKWDPGQYLMFRQERTQPAVDLLARIEKTDPQAILDIGCGPGNSTALLREKYPEAYILGIDNSPEMIEQAQKQVQNVSFMVCDASKQLHLCGQQFDILFSNACIQWIPNHRQLLCAMMSLLVQDGILAVQIPMNAQEPIHQIIKCVTQSGIWQNRFTDPRIFYQLTQSEYFDLLSKLSDNFTIWQTTYFHRLKNHEEILEWYRGTGLRPYLQQLSDAERPAFEREIFAQIKEAYPKQENGEILFRFPRFFFLAQKGGRDNEAKTDHF